MCFCFHLAVWYTTRGLTTGRAGRSTAAVLVSSLTIGPLQRSKMADKALSPVPHPPVAAKYDFVSRIPRIM